MGRIERGTIEGNGVVARVENAHNSKALVRCGEMRIERERAKESTNSIDEKERKRGETGTVRNEGSGKKQAGNELQAGTHW